MLHALPNLVFHACYACNVPESGHYMLKAALLQEDMYSYVTVADDQQFKGKSTEVVDA